MQSNFVVLIEAKWPAWSARMDSTVRLAIPKFKNDPNRNPNSNTNRNLNCTDRVRGEPALAAAIVEFGRLHLASLVLKV